jgi:hypothetical protein
MEKFRKLLLRLLIWGVQKLERRVALLRYQEWEEARRKLSGTNEYNNASFYDLGDGKEPSIIAVLYGGHITPPDPTDKKAVALFDGANAKAVINGSEYRLKVHLVRPHGADYEIRGNIEVLVAVKPTQQQGATVILPAKRLHDAVSMWRQEQKPIQLQLKKGAR